VLSTSLVHVSVHVSKLNWLLRSPHQIAPWQDWTQKGQSAWDPKGEVLPLSPLQSCWASSLSFPGQDSHPSYATAGMTTVLRDKQASGCQNTDRATLHWCQDASSSGCGGRR
jgi:hypothetical protein